MWRKKPHTHTHNFVSLGVTFIDLIWFDLFSSVGVHVRLGCFTACNTWFRCHKRVIMIIWIIVASTAVISSLNLLLTPIAKYIWILTLNLEISHSIQIIGSTNSFFTINLTLMTLYNIWYSSVFILTFIFASVQRNMEKISWLKATIQKVNVTRWNRDKVLSDYTRTWTNVKFKLLIWYLICGNFPHEIRNILHAYFFNNWIQSNKNHFWCRFLFASILSKRLVYFRVSFRYIFTFIW